MKFLWSRNEAGWVGYGTEHGESFRLIVERRDISIYVGRSFRIHSAVDELLINAFTCDDLDTTMQLLELSAVPIKHAGGGPGLP